MVQTACRGPARIAGWGRVGPVGVVHRIPFGSHDHFVRSVGRALTVKARGACTGSRRLATTPAVPGDASLRSCGQVWVKSSLVKHGVRLEVGGIAARIELSVLLGRLRSSTVGSTS